MKMAMVDIGPVGMSVGHFMVGMAMAMFSSID